MVRVYWGSKRIQALGEEKPVPPYSAIVYKEDDEVRAEDWKGRKIASGEAGVDDASVIQSALNAGGHIVISEGDYYIPSKHLVFPSNIILEGLGEKVNFYITWGVIFQKIHSMP